MYQMHQRLFSNIPKKERPNFTIGFIGSVRYVEQLKMLIDAVEESGSNIHILIAGDGPGYDEIERYCRAKLLSIYTATIITKKK